MKTKRKNDGAVFLIVIFAIAILTMVTVGILQMTTEELQLMQNQLSVAQAAANLPSDLSVILRGVALNLQ